MSSGAQQRQKGKEKKGDLCYYLTLFKLEGHSTWRAHLTGSEKGFEGERGQWVNAPKITEKKIIRIDRITAQFDIKE